MLARLAADALVSIGEPSLPRLIETLETGTGNARVEAARVLAKIGDINTIPVLTKLLDEDSAIIGYWADAALEKMGIGMVYFDPG
jgi:HEAT repeat protein